MSIIYEALKKLESHKKPLNIKKPEQFPNYYNLDKGSPISKSKSNNFFLPLILLVFLGLVFLSVKLVGFRDRQSDLSQNPMVKESFMDIAINKQNLFRGKNQLYNLEGVIYDEKKPAAIINGKIVNESDTLGDFVVKEITEDKVIMSNSIDQTSLVLSLAF